MQEKYNEAERLLRETVRQEEKALGAENPDTHFSKYWLAAVLYEQKEYQEAEQLAREAAEGQERVLGAENQHTLRSQRLLRNVQIQLAQPPTPTVVWEATRVREKVLNVEHEDKPPGQIFPQEVQAVLASPAKTTVASNPKHQEDGVLQAERQHTLRSRGLAQDTQTIPAPPAATTAISGPSLTRLDDYFVTGNGSRVPYTDSEISHISHLLRHLHPQWSKITRTYIVLRNIDCLGLIDTFVDIGFSDYLFPVTERSLPECLRPTQRTKSVAAQRLIMTKSIDLEKGENGEHRRFRRGEPPPPPPPPPPVRSEGCFGLRRLRTSGQSPELDQLPGVCTKTSVSESSFGWAERGRYAAIHRRDRTPQAAQAPPCGRIRWELYRPEIHRISYVSSRRYGPERIPFTCRCCQIPRASYPFRLSREGSCLSPREKRPTQRHQAGQHPGARWERVVHRFRAFV